MNNILILCNINDIHKAKEIVKFLLENHLIACSNIISNVASLYRWKGEICEDNEYLMIFKSHSELFEEIKTRIAEMHPYEVPEIISVEIKEGNKSYIDWLNGELK